MERIYYNQNYNQKNRDALIPDGFASDNGHHAFSLYALNSIVSGVVENGLNAAYWVVAELARVNENNGHCYMELIQKDDTTNTPVAQARAICWRGMWQGVSAKFQHATGQPLQVGQKVMLLVHAQFHVNYGFSWIVNDIDPSYTLGDMARRRQEIIKRLKAEGVFGLQKELRLPVFAQRIAVVSSAAAAGYGDFCHQLTNNDYGYQFKIKLFPAIMQGEQVEQSIIDALNAINEEIADFDCVVIIRGGGATSDLSGFDTLALGENVANFPLPVITGIGHERDESILDMISFVSVKTPTAAADFLIAHLADAGRRVDDAAQKVQQLAIRRVMWERQRLDALADKMPGLVSTAYVRHTAELDSLNSRLCSAVRLLQSERRQKLHNIEGRLRPAASLLLQDRRQKLYNIEGRLQPAVSILLQGHRHAIDNINGRITSVLSSYVGNRRHVLDILARRLMAHASAIVRDGRHRLGMNAVRLPSLVNNMVTKRMSRLQIIEATLKGYDPEKILRRGYSITLKDGHAVKDAAQLADGDVIVTRMYKGTVRSTVDGKECK